MHSLGTCLRHKTLTRGDTEEFSYNADARTPKNAVGPRDSTREQQTIRMLDQKHHVYPTSYKYRRDARTSVNAARDICCERAVICDGFSVLVAETSHAGKS
jgi:hypothetical protein